jgi:hypothetical protein
VEPTTPEPSGTAPILSATGAAGGAAITIEYVTVLVCALESVTVTLKAKVPLPPGDPEITPPFEIVTPDGRLPDERLHV